jgi:outer membrane immunogenic protein
MLRSLLFTTAIVAATGAMAADLDPSVLRGSYVPPPPAADVDWNGFYFGGFGGYTNGDFTLLEKTPALVGTLLRDTVIQNEFNVASLISRRKQDNSRTSFGGFMGYNWQEDDIVFGIELDYTRVGLRATAADAIGRQYTTSELLLYNVGLNASAETRLHDYGTLRARFGYVVGAFLPYVTAGIAVGRADRRSDAAVTLTWEEADPLRLTPPGIPRASGTFVDSLTRQNKNQPVVGLAGGVGVDWMLFPGALLRAEYQHIYFDEIRTTVSTGRVGLGVKF